jgi:hypothetical protein
MKLSELGNFHSIFPDHPTWKKSSDFFVYDSVSEKYTCILCGRKAGKQHGGRVDHMHYWHPEALK